MTRLIEHKVELTESEPVKRKPYPIPYKMQEVIDEEIEDMLAMGIIERSEAPYASPVVGNWLFDDILLRSHHTELNLTSTDLKPSLRQLLRRLWRRVPGLAAPLTLTPTLFLTISLFLTTRCLVQFICCERVLTMCDRLTTDRDRPLIICR